MDRRSLFAASMATVVAVGIAPVLATTPGSTWAPAMRKFEAHRAKEVAFDRAVWTPAYYTSNAGGPDIPDHIDDQMNALIDARCDAEEALIKTPAPSLSAVIWKMEYAHKRWEDFIAWPDAWWDAVMNDLRHLAGSAA